MADLLQPAPDAGKPSLSQEGGDTGAQAPRVLTPQEIERASMQTIEEALACEKHSFSALELPLVKRMIHATADFSLAQLLCLSEGAVQKALEALGQGATIVTDTNMALAGISKAALEKLGCTAVCYMADPEIARTAKETGVTRAWAGIDKAATLPGPVIFAIGNAPTALLRICELHSQGKLNPALVIGAPVGFVNVVEAKELLIDSGIPHVVIRGRRGGSTIACALVNALLYQLAEPGWRQHLESDGGSAQDTSAQPPAGTAGQRHPGRGLSGLQHPGQKRPSSAQAALQQEQVQEHVRPSIPGCSLAPDACIAIFAGTTEGRLLAERLCAAGRHVRIFVATPYGDSVLPRLTGADIRTGRLDAAQMQQALQGVDLVVDATHPYATVVTTTIREACAATGLACLRLMRPPTELPAGSVQVDNIQQAADFIASTSGNVLIATGSKDIRHISAALDPADRDRLYARVLPSHEALDACLDAGIGASHVQCLQGPFSHALNVALLHSCQARWMLTKDSGLEGGMPQKISAAQECACGLVVIRRPAEKGPTYPLDEIAGALLG